MNFLKLEGSTNKLSSSLFNMIIFLSLLIFLIHKKDFDCKKEELKQMTLDKYFK